MFYHFSNEILIFLYEPLKSNDLISVFNSTDVNSSFDSGKLAEMFSVLPETRVNVADFGAQTTFLDEALSSFHSKMLSESDSVLSETCDTVANLDSNAASVDEPPSSVNSKFAESDSLEDMLERLTLRSSEN